MRYSGKSWKYIESYTIFKLFSDSPGLEITALFLQELLARSQLTSRNQSLQATHACPLFFLSHQLVFIHSFILHLSFLISPLLYSSSPTSLHFISSTLSISPILSSSHLSSLVSPVLFISHPLFTLSCLTLVSSLLWSPCFLSPVSSPLSSPCLLSHTPLLS